MEGDNLHPTPSDKRGEGDYEDAPHPKWWDISTRLMMRGDVSAPIYNRRQSIGADKYRCSV